MRFIDGSAQNRDITPPFLSPHFRWKWGERGWGTRNITNRARDHCHFMSARGEQAREFMMTGPAGFI
jgi:hypothetical protein